MQSLAWIVSSLIAAASVSACTSEVLLDDGSTSSAGDVSGTSGAATSGGNSLGAQGPYGTPCSFLHGNVTLTSWQGGQDDGSYAKSAYSFELASNDVSVTKNDFDVLYVQNLLDVDTVTDDKSNIVDLGDVSLSALPSTIDLDAYPAGDDGAHDAEQAQLNHTYWVRTLDSNTEQVAAFRIVELSPGESMGIEWVRSLDPDTMVAPSKCK